MFPEPVISQAVEPKTKADQEKMGIALSRLAQEDPSFRVHTDEEIGPDHHLRHGRAAPGDPGRPHEARVRRRGQRRQAAGGLPRDDPQDGRLESKASSSSSRAAAASTATWCSRSSRPSRARATSSSTRSRAAWCRASSSRRSKGRAGDAARTACWPATRWWTSRSTLIFGSYHDVDSNENAFKMAASMAFKEGMRRAKPGAARADDGGGGGDARGLHGQRDGRPVVAPRHGAGHGRHGRRRQGGARPRCRWRRCSATRPPCAR